MVGGKCYVLGTRRPKGESQSTRQTPGVADLLVFLPPARHLEPWSDYWTLVCVECKAAKGRLSEPQEEFRDLCRLARVAHLSGGLTAFSDYLKAGGWVR